jgi:spore coat protein U-like protein
MRGGKAMTGSTKPISRVAVHVRVRILRAVAVCLAALLTIASQETHAACNLNVQGVIFGSYDVFNVQSVESTGNVAVTCDVSTPYSIAFTPGSGSYASRTLTSGPNTLGYNLYSDPARTSVWGDGTAGTMTVSGSATSANHTVYGRIPARQNVFAGSYSDLITVTLTF